MRLVSGERCMKFYDWQRQQFAVHDFISKLLQGEVSICNFSACDKMHLFSNSVTKNQRLFASSWSNNNSWRWCWLSWHKWFGNPKLYTFSKFCERRQFRVNFKSCENGGVEEVTTSRKRWHHSVLLSHWNCASTEKWEINNDNKIHRLSSGFDYNVDNVVEHTLRRTSQTVLASQPSTFGST